MPAMAAEELTPSQMDTVSAGLLNAFTANVNLTGQVAGAAATATSTCAVAACGLSFFPNSNAQANAQAQNNNATFQF